MKKSVSIITLGCKVNQYESLGIADLLKKKGYIVNIGLIKADIFVLNTCAVTNESERKSRGLIAKVKKLNPKADIYVCGCSAQNNPDKFLEREGVRGVCGTSDKTRIVKMIEQGTTNDVDISIIPEYDEVYKPIKNRTRCYIKIQDGCNNFCSYCIIPYLRGRERSRSLDEIKKEIDSLESETKEIILTGINMSGYGSENGYKETLADVVKLFENRNVRFRISSLEAKIITHEFLQILSKMSNFCPHFHLSMQSGSNKVLCDMNRHYTKEEFLDKVKLIRQYFPNAGITTDVIVGFATETEECFEETMVTVKKAAFSEMHIFPYSPRNGTIALKLKSVAKDVPCRVKKLTQLASVMKEDFIKSNIGLTHEVLIEERVGDEFVGHTKNYIKCYLPYSEKVQTDTIVDVKITEVYSDGAKAVFV